MKSRLPEGYGGKGMSGMLKQAQKMQEEMAALQQELQLREYTASSGGAMVEATVTGDKQVVGLKINPEVASPDDVEMLADLVIAAVGEAQRLAGEDAETSMSKITGGFDIPGMM